LLSIRLCTLLKTKPSTGNYGAPADLPPGPAPSGIPDGSQARPELFRLLSDSKQGDVLLIEQVDRLSRLTDGDWKRLRSEIEAKGVRVVALDLPTSWQMAMGDEFTQRMFAAINSMLLDMLAAMARKDYEDRRRRQSQRIVKAKAEGLYRGRREDVARNAGIAGMLRSGMSWTSIQAATGCSRATIAKVKRITFTDRDP
jgi:DNA invertase Pin-like site-specific DNA recombinase